MINGPSTNKTAHEFPCFQDFKKSVHKLRINDKAWGTSLFMKSLKKACLSLIMMPACLEQSISSDTKFLHVTVL